MRSVRAVAFAAVVAALAVTGVTAFEATPVVDTTHGPIQGEYNPKSGINMFKGIPYAAPPVGNLRFADPEKPAQWTSVLNTSQFSPGCMARCPPVGFPKPELMCTPTVSEDCLYLNVYAPKEPSKPTMFATNERKAHFAASDRTPTSLPVIMFIHGGNFEFGSGGVPLYDGQQMASTQQVIVVTINYRLNVFGGLYTGSGSIEGNFQLKDQILAMKWVQANIAAFGGDPNRVTLTGQSAGAASTTAHLTLPASKGLFNNVIIVSNPATLLLADPDGAIQLGTKVSEGLGCPISGGEAQIECLRSASAEDVLNMSSTDYSFNPHTLLNDMMQWVPVVDGTLVPQQPLDAFEKGNFTKVPVFFGTVANESVEFIFKLDEKPMSVLTLDALLATIFGVDTAVKVREVYGDVPESMKSDVRPYLEVIATDFVFYCVNRHIGSQLTSYVPTFMYYYDYLSYANEWVFGKSMPFCVHNVCHAEDLSSIFFPFDWIPMEPGEPFPPPQREIDLSAIVQAAWGNFAWGSNPNPIGTGLPVTAITPGTQFPQFNASQNVLVNYSTPTSNLVGYRDSVCDFWDTVGYRPRR